MFASYFKGIEQEDLSSVECRLTDKRRQIAETGAAGLTTAFDVIFAQHGRGLPIPFLRALASKESNFKPDSELRKGIDLETRVRQDTGKRDSYWGLFQVGIKNVLKGFNKAHGTDISKDRLFNAEVNTTIASWQIRHQIIDAYNVWSEKHNIPELKTNWNNLNWVKLVLAGWNSGHSRAGGVQAAALYLKSRGLPITHDNLFRHGKVLYKGKVKKAKYLNQEFDKKRRWQAATAKRYFKELGRENHDISPRGGGGGGLIAAGLLAAGLLLAKGVG